MTRFGCLGFAVVLAIALGFTRPASAGIAGPYKVSMSTTMTAPNCTWVGEASMMQVGLNVSGNATLNLDTSGEYDILCLNFPTLAGTIVGTSDLHDVNLITTLNGGLIVANFVGTTTPQGLTASGTWTSPQEPPLNLRLRGVWEAERIIPAAPLLGARSIGLLVLSLLAVGAWSMFRPRRVDATN